MQIYVFGILYLIIRLISVEPNPIYLHRSETRTALNCTSSDSVQDQKSRQTLTTIEYKLQFASSMQAEPTLNMGWTILVSGSWLHNHNVLQNTAICLYSLDFKYKWISSLSINVTDYRDRIFLISFDSKGKGRGDSPIIDL